MKHGIREKLSSIVDEKHRIRGTKREQKGMDRITDTRGIEYDATKFTYESEKVIDVNEKGQTVVTEREINTYGFANRTPGFFPRDIGLNKMQYPIGPVLGYQSENQTCTIIEDGTEMDYSVTHYGRTFVPLNKHELKVDITKGNYYAHCSDLGNLYEYGIDEKISQPVDVLTDIGKFLRVSRQPDLTTASVRVAVGNNDKLERQRVDFVDGNMLYSDGLRDLPDIIVTDEDLSRVASQQLPAYPINMTDIHKVIEEEKNPEVIQKKEELTEEVKKHRENKEGQLTFLTGGKLSRLATKNGLIPGTYSPEQVELDDGQEYSGR